MVKFSRPVDSELYRKVPQTFIEDFLKSSWGKEEMTLYGGLSKRKATKAFLYHMVTGKSYQAMEWVVGIKHSNCRQVFGTIRRALFRYSRNKIDSSDFKLQKQDDEDWRSEWYSKKEKCHAAKYQFIASHDRIVRYVSGSFSPKKNTIHFACVVTESCW